MRKIKGSGGGGCFAGHTPVKTGDREKRIDQIKEGDYVWSFDHEGRIHESKVLKVHKHEDEKIVEYKLWGGTKLCATPNHWVLNQYNAFVEIGSLGFDDCLVNTDDHLLPIIGKKELENGTVYNLTVEDHHTFFAGGVRVHNAGLGLGISGSGGGRGSKGGGGSRRTPVEADDSLQSRQYASVLDLIGEGEIQGLDDGLKSVYLEGTPVQDSAGNDNFEGYTVTTKTGTQGQAYIADMIGAQSEKAVNVEVTKATSVTRQITDTDVDRVRVTIQIPSLQIFTDEGDIIGHSVEYNIQLQYNSGGFNIVKSDTVTGKTGGSYQRDYVIPLTGAFPVDVKVVRVSADETSAKRNNVTNWTSYSEIIDDKLRYPNSALVHLRFDARNFSSVPVRKYLIRGIKVKIPHNATVDTTTHLGRITYSGTFNGTLGAATWTSDPAWCLWDLLTNTRYGCSIPESSLDRYDFYTISQYCNELVSNGKGGQEPRFSLNLLINARDEMFNVIQELTAIFRGITYYSAGSLVLLQDKPSDSQYLLGPSNVVNGDFIYSGTSQKARHTTATVAWQDYDALGEVQYEYVEDADAISKFGVINADYRAVGCYSQGQANRVGKWLLLAENNLTETVSFGVSIESGIFLRPGMVIDIADPVRAGTRRSGRCASGSSTTVIKIDSDTDLSVNLSNSPTLSLLSSNGLLETKTISGISGTSVTVSSAFKVAPAAQAVWLIQTSDVQAQQYRVLNVIESGDGTFAITALQYNSSMYGAVESNLNLTTRSISELSVAPAAVTGISTSEFLYEQGQGVHSGVEISWNAGGSEALEYAVKYRVGTDNWTEATTTAPSFTIKDTKVGTMEIQVQAINNLGKGGQIATASVTIAGKTSRPADVQNLNFEAISANSGRLRWDQTVDLDVKVGGRVQIKHNNEVDGSGTWSNSVELIPAQSGVATEAIIPLIEGEVLVRFVDDGGNASSNSASVIIDLPDTKTDFGLLTQREDLISPTPFSGTKTGCHYSSDFDALVLDGDSIDNETDFDAIKNFDYLSPIGATGTYNFAEKVDLGAVYSLDLKRHISSVGYLPQDQIDSITNWDNRADLDGEVHNVNAELYVRTTNNDPASGSATWGTWQKFAAGTYKARGYDFKSILTSTNIDENIRVTELGVKADFQNRTEKSVIAVASGSASSGKTITFAKPFFVGTSTLGGLNSNLPSIGIVGQNLQSGDFFNVTSVSGSNFVVKFMNGSSVVDRNFLWTANGYGLGS